MSLFPAYENYGEATDDDCKIIDNQADNDDWLRNSSFQTTLVPQKPVIEISSDSSDDESVQILPAPAEEQHEVVSLDSDTSLEEVIPVKRPKKHKSKKHSRKGKPKVKYELDVENVYFEDRKRDRGNCHVSTLPSRARSTYTLKPYCLGFVSYKYQQKKENQQKKASRYFSTNLDTVDKLKKIDTVISRESCKRPEEQEKNTIESLPTVEEEQKSRTKEFNEKLAESPHDIDLWLSYIKFQDVAQKFDKSQTRESKMAFCQKKLSIVEKALDKNPNSKDLLREKLYLMGEMYPADQLSNYIENLVNKDTGNILLWQAYIMATQTSVAMCTTPKIINLYAKFFNTLRLWSRTSSQDHDERLLEMQYHSFIFLRQAGLWEQMWEALRMNLSLNLGLSKDALLFKKSIDEKKLIELEEVILTSRLPLNQLWLRVESLRENSHWISVDREQLELIGDSHRFTSPEDVTDFVHPMLTRNSNMRLAIYALLALKVPLLPTSDWILKTLELEKCGWSIDSIEALLAMFYSAGDELAGHDQRNLLLKGLLAGGLTSGPQYLRYHPAQEPYLDFVRDTFRVIADSLSSVQRTSLYAWWLRFERMLVFICKDEPKSENRRKKLKGLLKEFLKKDENRNNLYFYREYSLIEREMGRYDSCINILETAIKSAPVTTQEEKTALLSLRRTLVQVLLDVRNSAETSTKVRVNQVLSQLVSSKAQTNIESIENHFREYLSNFLAEPSSDEAEFLHAYFLPNSTCDNIACYAYFLYANDRDVHEILDIYSSCLEHAKENKYLQERFYENEIAILQAMNERHRGHYKLLVERLNIALNCYPNNFYLLSVFAGIKSELPNWKLNTRKENDKPWQVLSYCLAGRARINSFLERGMKDAATAAINKLIHYHRRLVSSPDVQHCPLVWRLLMLLLREQNLSQEKGEEVYHEGVAQCPWSRSIYIDAAEVAPHLLTQIQDVLREKDLRMHVTPEELDILRE